MRTLVKFFLLISLLATSEACSHTTDSQFPLWVSSFKQEARQGGISEKTLRILDTLRFNPRIIALDRKQPEARKTFNEYASSVLSKKKIQQARRLYRENYALLATIGKTYGVQPRFIVALWGIETNFGSITGDFNIVNSLATLAYEGRRRDLFKKELMQALTMIDTHQASQDMMKGSWAGAMGQTQFMPSSFRKFAVDYDRNGKADIWRSKGDVFASIANYLSKTGWDSNSNWGREIMVPPSFDRNLAKITLVKPVAEWQNLGIRTLKGENLPAGDTVLASIIIPGDGEKAFLVYANYKTLMDWNRSYYFATTVGLLADAIGKM
jgi:membrane-bound lytic murein transglycosylase B